MSEFNSTFEIACSRRTCNAFKRAGVERAKIGRILESARWAPSPGAVQSLEFIVVEDPDVKENVAKLVPLSKTIKQAPLNIVVLANLTRAKSRYNAKDAQKYVLQESAACIENMLLVAHEQGLGTCWIGEFQSAKLKSLLKIPEDIIPIAIISIGYPQFVEEYKKPFKYKITEITFWNNYGTRVSPVYDKFEWMGLKNYSETIKKRFFRRK